MLSMCLMQYTESLRGFWENLKGYYYAIRKSFTCHFQGLSLPSQTIIFIRKNIFACLSIVHNIISLSYHKQVRFIKRYFERYFFHHPYLGKRQKWDVKAKMRCYLTSGKGVWLGGKQMFWTSNLYFFYKRKLDLRYDIILSQTIMYYWQEVFLLTLVSDSEGIV